MTNPVENTTTAEEIQIAFSQSYGSVIGQLTFQKLSLEKQNQSLRSSLNDTEEVAFALKRDNANLIKAQVSLENQINILEDQAAKIIEQDQTIQEFMAKETEFVDRIQELEANLADLAGLAEWKADFEARNDERPALSPEVSAIAAEGSAIIAKEKAAPEDG